MKLLDHLFNGPDKERIAKELNRLDMHITELYRRIDSLRDHNADLYYRVSLLEAKQKQPAKAKRDHGVAEEAYTIIMPESKD